jgi:putative methyltransferase
MLSGLSLTAQDAAGWLQATAQQQQPQSLQQQPTVPHPRHARINTLKADVQQVLQQLRGAGSTGKHSSSGSTNSSAGAGGGYDVYVDGLLPDLLVFPPGTDLHDHPLVEQGELILQVCAEVQCQLEC